MRNLLFVSSNDITPLNGGIDRVVDVLAGEFSQYPEYKCFLAYFYDLQSYSTSFEKKIKIDRKHAKQICSDFIVANHIHIILVNMLVTSDFKFILPILYEIAKEQTHCKIIFVYHNQPGFEKERMKIDAYLYRIFHGKNLFSNLKDLTMQVISFFLNEKTIRKYLGKKYKLIYQYSDKIVLLSASHLPLFALYAGMPIDDKFTAIGNALSFPATIGKDEIKKKEKIVLIVSRLEEKQKRISLALKIWENIEKLDTRNEWKLIILGSGIDETYYRKTTEKKHLKRVSFEGARLPEAYYRKSSIFMMTSAYEGFGLTLTESLQMGISPIVFDSFSALHDIINDGYNGFIIPNNDIATYVGQLLWLMNNEEQRLAIAQNAIESSRKFELSGIVKQWFDLFDGLFQTKLQK